MTRVTLRLPEDLYERIRASSQRRGASLNQTIIDALEDAVPGEESLAADKLSLDEERRRVREALGDLVVEIDPEELRRAFGLSGTIRPSGERIPLPPITPPLSQTIIEEREDRF